MSRHDALEVPESTLEAWQQSVDVLAEMIGLPSALITRVVDDEQMEILVSSRTPGNIFVGGEVIRREKGHFFEEVLRQGGQYLVPDIDKVESLRRGPSARQGMYAFFGMPLLWPDGSAFGCICVMDSSPNKFSPLFERLVAHFRENIKLHLTLLFQQFELREKTRRDTLTGACTRREFFETGHAELRRARRYGIPLALLLMDFDHFKRVNDEYGHAAGDATLKQLSRRVMDSLRSSDRFYRLGGEEFVILLPHTELDEGHLVAERVRVLVESRPVEFAQMEIPVTLSIGLTVLEGGGETLDDIVAKADRALYRAKERGRNRVEVFERLRAVEG